MSTNAFAVAREPIESAPATPGANTFATIRPATPGADAVNDANPTSTERIRCIDALAAAMINSAVGG